eukprot:TRINITY_DN31625_c0_g1_i1.p1 TRINITY_DN31625_c0_g1~~TRINITY_DN31625_c0_g1_i1.p1  ORF type:complete len:164 (-),score=49.10 TRINITY_DN31625_c0_g1_i1:306-755(-)
MEAFFGKWKTDHAFDENVDAFMEADSIPEEYREKMKEMDVSFSLEEVANEPGKYDWKIELGEMFTIDEFFEIGVPHTIINPVSGEEVTAVIELTSEGVLNSVMTKPSGDTVIQVASIVDDGEAMELEKTYQKEGCDPVTAKTKMVKTAE